MNRRQFLATTSLAALAGCATLPGRRGGDIDAHVHVWPREDAPFPPADAALKRSVQPASFTPEQLLAQCRPEGVNRVVLIQMSFYESDNRYLLDAIRRFPGTFRGVAIVDERRAGVAATMRRLAAGGVRGFRLYADRAKSSAWRDSAGLRAMWQCGAESNLAMCLLADPDALPAIDRMCREYPDTPVVVDHFARLGMRGPVQERELALLLRLARFPRVHLKTSAFYALGAKRAPYTDLGPMIRRVRDAFGASRLMWGSDCPFQVENGHAYRDSIALIRDRLDFLTAEDRRWMLRSTAEKVFFS